MDKLYKSLIVSITTIAIIFIFELISFIPGFDDFFISVMQDKNSWLTWVGMWVIMFIQVTFIPIPAIAILTAANNIGMIQFNLIQDSLFYIVVMSSYMVGVIVAYLIGRKWGSKAVNWISGDPEVSKKWSDAINDKGKFFYFLTVLFPIFPDDLLCIVAGAIKLDFKYFVISNLIGRLIGLVTTVYVLLNVINLVGSLTMLIVYGTLLLINIISIIIIKKYLTAKQ